jgi:hypothetical protein
MTITDRAVVDQPQHGADRALVDRRRAPVAAHHAQAALALAERLCAGRLGQEEVDQRDEQVRHVDARVLCDARDDRDRQEQQPVEQPRGDAAAVEALEIADGLGPRGRGEERAAGRRHRERGVHRMPHRLLRRAA